MSDIDNTQDEPTIEQLRAQADENKHLRAQIAQGEREKAFILAGLPTESKPAKAFIRDYDGELDPVKIKEAAVEWGLWKPEGSDATTDEPDPTEGDRDKLRNAGHPSDAEPPKPNPVTKALEEFRDIKAGGARREDAALTVIGALVKGGVEKDERVIIPSEGLQRSHEFRDVPYQDGRART